MNSAPHMMITRNKRLTREDDLEALGWKFTHHDFIRKTIEIPARLSSSHIQENITITSQTGVQAFVEILHRFKLNKANHIVFCIGNATKDLALHAGLVVHGSAPDARSLADEILKHPSVKSITHVAGSLRRGELYQTLEQSGVVVSEIVAYRTELTPTRLDVKVDGIVFYSPSAVESFLQENPLPKSACFCIGQTTADHAKRMGCEWVYSANAPTDEALLTLITGHFSKTIPHA